MLRIRVCAEIDADRQHVRLVRCCPKNTLGDDAIEDVLCGGDQVGNVSRLVLDDSNNPFWNEPQEAKLEPRGRVRYVIPRGLPLWFDEHEETLVGRWPFLERDREGIYRLPEGMPSLPLMYSLRAGAEALDRFE